MLGEPRGDLAVLHVWPRRNVDEEVAQRVPVTHYIHAAWSHFRILGKHGGIQYKITVSTSVIKVFSNCPCKIIFKPTQVFSILSYYHPYQSDEESGSFFDKEYFSCIIR